MRLTQLTRIQLYIGLHTKYKMTKITIVNIVNIGHFFCLQSQKMLNFCRFLIKIKKSHFSFKGSKEFWWIRHLSKKLNVNKYILCLKSYVSSVFYQLLLKYEVAKKDITYFLFLKSYFKGSLQKLSKSVQCFISWISKYIWTNYLYNLVSLK